MKQIVQAALSELELDYKVTMIAGGEKRNYDVVFFDEQTGEYFSIHVSWAKDLTGDSVKEDVKGRLQERLKTSNSNQVSCAH